MIVNGYAIGTYTTLQASLYSVGPEGLQMSFASLEVLQTKIKIKIKIEITAMNFLS